MSSALIALIVCLCIYAVYVVTAGSRRYECQCPICKWTREDGKDVNRLLRAIDEYSEGGYRGYTRK